jgi:23S rRNA (cytidine2498-2'-O)-methyltransferase
VLCQQRGQRGLDLCVNCQQLLALTDSCCPGCALPLPAAAFGLQCGRCQTRSTRIHTTVAACRYEAGVSGLITGFKYHRQLAGGRALTALLLDAIRDRVSTTLQNAGITLDESAEHVLSLVVDDKPEAAWFTGLRKRRAGDPLPCGGLPRITLPSHAPSRAWLKLEQALAFRGWDKADLHNQNTLDLGCSPGGASLALLDRGMKVIGVDTGDMDESVLRHDSGGFRHLRVPLARLDTSKLPSTFDLLLCDINLAPPEVLPHIASLCQTCRVPRLILTLKLNHPSFEQRVDEFVGYIRSFAPGPVFVTQLAANRREVCVIAGA